MEGNSIPQAVFKTRVRDDSIVGANPYRWQDIDSRDLFRGKRVVVFSLPGAFTPTCSNRQCPAFERAYEDIRALGVDEVCCISVNDAFVIHNWGQKLRTEEAEADPGWVRSFHASHGHAGQQGPSRFWLSQLALRYGGR